MKYFITTVWNWYRPLSISRVKDSVPTVFLRGLSYPSDCGSDSCWGSDNEVGVCLWLTLSLTLTGRSDSKWGFSHRVGVQSLTHGPASDRVRHWLGCVFVTEGHTQTVMSVYGFVCVTVTQAWHCPLTEGGSHRLSVNTGYRTNRICFTQTKVVLLPGATCLKQYRKVINNPQQICGGPEKGRIFCSIGV